MKDLKVITASLDDIASKLQMKGLVRLAAQVDEVTNSLEMVAGEEVEAGLLGSGGMAALLALGLVVHGKAKDLDSAMAMVGKLPPTEKSQVLNNVKKVAPSLTETIKDKMEGVLKPLELQLKGPGAPKSEIEEQVTKKVEEQAEKPSPKTVRVSPA